MRRKGLVADVALILAAAVLGVGTAAAIPAAPQLACAARAGNAHPQC